MAAKRIPLAILAWLDAQVLPQAEREEVAMAMDVLENVFKVNRADLPAARITAATLESWALAGAGSAAEATGAAGAAGAAAPPPSAAATATAGAAAAASSADAKAEQLKAEGNAALVAQRFAHAEELYSEAIELSPAGKNSHIYFANRAAARLHLKNYEGCAEDARESVRLSEGYAKGWIKLGQALHKLGRHQEGAEAYGTAERLEPDNKAAASGRAECLKALKASSSVSSGSTGSSSSSSSSARAAPRAPAGGFDPSALAGLMGGAGGAGGNPMNNPMVQNMVSSAAKDPELAASMSDPDVMAAMAEIQGAMAGGGGPMAAMPVIMKHMGNPKMSGLVSKIMGSMGGGGMPF